MDLDITQVIEFLNHKRYIREVSVENDSDPDVYMYGPTCVPVLCYVIQFLSDSEGEDDVLRQTLRLLVDSARKWSWSRSWVLSAEPVLKISRDVAVEEHEKEDQFLSRTFLQDFVPQVQKFFKFPTKMLLGEDKGLQRNEVLAAFMDFLLQIWNSEVNINDDSSEGQKHALINKDHWYGLLHNELKYLLGFLGDVPFQCNTDQLQDDRNTLLAGFEVVANQAGHFTFLCILSPNPDRFTEFNAGRGALFPKIQRLKKRIKKYCKRFSQLPIAITTSRVKRTIDSLFIVDSLLEDALNLKNRQFRVTIPDDMKDQIEALYEGLKLPSTFLKDTKMPQETEDDAIKECFIMIRDSAYEAEYLINSYLVGNIPAWYLRLRLPAVIHKIKHHVSRLQEIKKAYKVMPLIKDFVGELSVQHTKTATKMVESLPDGFQETKTKILDGLIGGQKELQIISLYGMPGLGKTTLAKNLYDHPSVREHFDRRVWCVISQTYKKRKVLLEILTSLNETSLSNVDDEVLSLKIYQSLKNRRYLIIIDDIWDSSTWDDIKNCFPHGKDDKTSSRTMVTSRSEDAAPRESIYHTLPLLSPGECLDLLVKKVFNNEPYPHRLLDIAKRIAGKCHGLPLAIVTVAGILANLDKQKSAWQEVERNLQTFKFDDKGECMNVLEFSYEHLPCHLKLCYLYLGTFPEDTEISVRRLIRLWIAEGFVQKEETKSREDVANEFFSNKYSCYIL